MRGWMRSLAAPRADLARSGPVLLPPGGGNGAVMAGCWPAGKQSRSAKRERLHWKREFNVRITSATRSRLLAQKLYPKAAAHSLRLPDRWLVHCHSPHQYPARGRPLASWLLAPIIGDGGWNASASGLLYYLLPSVAPDSVAPGLLAPPAWRIPKSWIRRS